MASGQAEDNSKNLIDDMGRSDESDQMNLMSLIRGAQKVSQAIETYNQLNEK